MIKSEMLALKIVMEKLNATSSRIPIRFLQRLCDEGGSPVRSEVLTLCLKIRQRTMTTCSIAWFLLANSS